MVVFVYAVKCVAERKVLDLMAGLSQSAGRSRGLGIRILLTLSRGKGCGNEQPNLDLSCVDPRTLITVPYESIRPTDLTGLDSTRAG